MIVISCGDTFLQWRSSVAMAAIQDVLTGRLAISQTEMSTILRAGRHTWDQERSSRIRPPGYVSFDKEGMSLIAGEGPGCVRQLMDRPRVLSLKIIALHER